MEGLNGGILTMLLFIWILICGFSWLGKALAIYKDEMNHVKYVVWALGAALFTHVMSFTSVVYFDQMVVFWYLLLSMISAACLTPRVEEKLRK